MDEGINPDQILYVTFDSPILKLTGLDGVLKFWEDMRPKTRRREYLFFDEIQYTSDWQTWLKHEVDFNKRRRIVVTGSAIPLTTENVESGVGRWHTIKLSTLSFFEYLQIRGTSLPALPMVRSLAKIFDWKESERTRVSVVARELVPHFHDYLLRGGFPETARVEHITTAQKLLREDIVDKVLKRDMTALFGTRNVLELEKTFLYLCLHDGGILDKKVLCANLELKKGAVDHFLDLLEAAHLIYRLRPFGYGKEILRGKQKVYLADAAIAGSVLLKGRALLEDSARLGAAVETAFFKHVFTRYYSISIGFSFWRNSKTGNEVDLVAEVQGETIPFEVKYSDSLIDVRKLKGLREFCNAHALSRGYVITRRFNDFGPLTLSDSKAVVLKIPAPLACYWLSQSEGQ